MADQFQVITHGFRELEAAFADVRVRIDPALGKALRMAAKPVAAAAEANALTHISNIGPRWSKFKVGSRRTLVFVTERQKRQPGGSPRPNLSRELLVQALLPAVRDHQLEVLETVKLITDEVIREAKL